MDTLGPKITLMLSVLYKNIPFKSCQITRASFGFMHQIDTVLTVIIMNFLPKASA